MGASTDRDSRSGTDREASALATGQQVARGPAAKASTAPARGERCARFARSLFFIPAFGLLLLAGLWLALAHRIETQRDATLAAAMRGTESFADAFSEYTLRSLRDIDRTAWLVKAQFERDGMVDLPYLIRHRLVPIDGPVRVSVTNSTGNIIATTGEFGVTVNVADRDYFRRHLERDTGDLDVSRPMPGPYSGEPSIEMTRRLNLGDRAFGGVVILSVAPAYFVDFYRASQLGTQGMLAVVGTDGLFRARRAGDDVAAAIDATTTPLFAAAKVNDEGSYVGESVIDGTRRLVAYRKVPGYPLIVAVAQAEAEILGDFARDRHVYFVTGVVASLVIIGFFAANTLLAYRARRSARDVRHQRRFLQALIDNIPVGVVVRSVKNDDRGRIVVWNPAAAFVFGVPAAGALNRRMSEITPPDFARGLEERDRDLLASPMVQDLPQVTALVPHRGRRVLRVIRAPIFSGDDQVEHVLSIIHDVTEEQARADELRLHAKVFATIGDGIILTDADDRVIAVNAAFSALTGYAPADMVGKAILESPFRPTDPAQYEVRQQQLAATGRVTQEVLRYRSDGSELACWLTKTCVHDEDGRIVNYVRAFTDISRLKDAQRQLEQLASVDTLTGLLNRRMFLDRLEAALARTQRSGSVVGLLFIDLDGFKRVNDIHGHDAGDALLREVAQRLQRCVRAGDSLCRLGGDEFTIVVESASLPADALALADRIMAILDAPFTIAGKSIGCQASIGIAVSPDHGRDAETLQRCADTAMYRAKRAGGRRRVLGAAPFLVTLKEQKIAL
jgi:diguanylate cyclase (GGDEF)-like protein/PAS domain S-box-containing protein